MQDPVVYDKAKWHYDGDFPKDLESDNAFHHTGFFIGWILDNNLYDPEFFEGDFEQKLIAKFKSREITGAQFYEQCLDGAFVDDELNDEGNAFAQAYFDFEKGKYLTDYEELLTKNLPSMYHTQDTWENYEKLKARIDQRYSEWKEKQ